MNWFMLLDFAMLAFMVLVGFLVGWSLWAAFWTGILVGFIWVRYVENRFLGVSRE